MRSLIANLSSKLPPLGSQRFLADPFSYAKFWIPEVNWAWYVIEGEPSEQGFRFYGYVIGLDEEWEEFSLRDLEVIRGPHGQRVRRDNDFVPGRWSEVNEVRTGRKRVG